MIEGHGGNKSDLAIKLGCSIDDIIDMSSNLNPLGPPERIEQIIVENFSKIRSLPEPDARSMRKGFARYHGISEDNVIAGNGTTWFIYTIPIALNSRKVLISGPTYSDYKDACLMYDIPFEHCLSNAANQFVPDIDELSQMAKTADTVFICNPNNPTGSMVSKDKLLYLLQKHEETLFIIDESYLPFVNQAKETSLVSDTQHRNLVVLSSMSKIFKIPGLRTGFLSGVEPLVKKIMKYYQPWSVNALAQAVIEDIFDHPETIEPFYQKTRDYITKQRDIFINSLAGINGLELFNSHTYFSLARLTNGMTSKAFCDLIGKQKILIRDCENFVGLSDHYIRFSLKENQVNSMLSKCIIQTLR